ncbi:heme ABC transporter ATP-binding protein [Shivajiella indica]|uniref:Heme ABC transporter ATP-binding protein n=1 Tax=Shivajiella indica TaxID=872115 RepID=A0ABW5BA34_9BACT
MLEAKNIQYLVQGRPIVNKVSLQLIPGHLTAVIGPNGAGKSSLLKVLVGDYKPLGGEITYNGKPIQTYRPKELAKIRAVMPQHSQLTFPFKAKEVVELGLLSLGFSQQELIIKEVMIETQTWGFRDRLYTSLSGGERQRVQLARVLVQVWIGSEQPKFLFLDEPTSSLDITHQHQVLHIASKLKQKGIAVMAILHDLNMAAAYADHVILLKEGKIYHQGSTEKVMSSQHLEYVFEHPIIVRNGYEGIPYTIQSLPIQQKNQTYKTV